MLIINHKILSFVILLCNNFTLAYGDISYASKLIEIFMKLAFSQK